MRICIVLTALIVLTACDMNKRELRSVSVTGVGTIATEPDVAIVRLGVDTREATSRETLAANNATMAAIITALKGLGVDEQDIRTESLNLNPRYEHLRDRQGRSTQHLVGYRASNVVSVRLKDLATAGEIIDAASTAGVNRVDSISFEVTDPAGRLQQARDLAWADALTQAQQLATLAGASLGPVLTVTTGNTSPQYATHQPIMRAEMDAVPVAGGRQNISATVNVTWSIIE